MVETSQAVESRPPRPLLNQVWAQHRTAITRTIALAIILGGWEWAVRSGGISPLFLAGPVVVLQRLAEVFIDGSIWPHIAASGQVALLGFAIAVVAGVPIGVWMGRSRLVRDILEPIIMAKYSAPTVAFLPLLILWLGIDLASKVALVTLGAVFIIIINTESGVSNVDRRLLETARSFCASEADILLKVVLPSSLPFIIAGFRLAIGRVLIMVVVAEFYASTAGIGYLIFQAGAAYDTADLFVGVIILAATGVVANSSLRALEKRLAPSLSAQVD